jgi:ankyrin repeat protein
LWRGVWHWAMCHWLSWLLTQALVSASTMRAGRGGEGDASAGVGGPGGKGWVPISDEARLVLFFRCRALAPAVRPKIRTVGDTLSAIQDELRPVGAEEACAVAVKWWTGDERMSGRYGRDLVRSATPLRVLLDCTDLVLVVAEYLQTTERRREDVEECLCLGAFGGHRAMVDVASSVLFGTTRVAQQRLAVNHRGSPLAWWAGAGGQRPLFRELVWGVSGSSAVASFPQTSRLVCDALRGAARGGFLDDCRRLLDHLSAHDLPVALAGDSDGVGKARTEGVTHVLSESARGGHVEVLDWVLKLAEKEGIVVSDAQLGKALHLAVETGRASVVEKLVTMCGDRLDVNAKSWEGRTALQEAAEWGHAAVVELLVSMCGDRLDVNAKCERALSPLLEATAQNHASVVERLVSMCGDRLDVNTVDWESRTALHWAAQRDHSSVVEVLVSLCGDRLDVNARDAMGKTALMWAVQSRSVSVVEKLVSLCGDRLDLDVKDKQGKTIMHWAAIRSSDSEMTMVEETVAVKRLMEMLGDKVDVSAKDANGRTALFCGGGYPNGPVVEALVDLIGNRFSARDVNAQDRLGMTALHCAVASNLYSLVDKLVSALGDRLDVNARDGEGRTALHWAVHGSPENMVERLLSALGDRLDVNARDGEGRTALHWAAKKGLASTVERLVCAFGDRLDVNAKDARGRTARDLAVDSNPAYFDRHFARVFASLSQASRRTRHGRGDGQTASLSHGE